MLREPRGTTRATAASFFFCPIRYQDCIAHHPSTSCLYPDISINFPGVFLTIDFAAWPHGHHPRDTRCTAILTTFVRMWIFTDSSSPPQTSSSLPHLAHTRSDQPMCMTHPAPVASVLIMRVSSLSMEGCCCILSSGSSGATRGLLRCYMLTAHCLLCTT